MPKTDKQKIVALRKAIRPFAAIADTYTATAKNHWPVRDAINEGWFDDLTIGDLRRARAAFEL